MSMSSGTSVERLNNYVGGQWIRPPADTDVEVLCPLTNTPLAVFGETTAEGVAQAIAAAEDAFDAWAKMLPHRRARLLMRLKDLMVENHDKIARTLTIEHGKTLK
ncbi:MAG: aldehyde dehydrogenase family protein, partial [Planctomycetes bacterium]|nr:aldehyde dehydrogenase family protein [Planctomycetota bacterium]